MSAGGGLVDPGGLGVARLVVASVVRTFVSTCLGTAPYSKHVGHQQHGRLDRILERPLPPHVPLVRPDLKRPRAGGGLECGPGMWRTRSYMHAPRCRHVLDMDGGMRSHDGPVRRITFGRTRTAMLHCPHRLGVSEPRPDWHGTMRRRIAVCASTRITPAFMDLAPRAGPGLHCFGVSERKEELHRDVGPPARRMRPRSSRRCASCGTTARWRLVGVVRVGGGLVARATQHA